MCGRYSLTTPAEAVRRVFGYPERPNLMPRANIAPTQEVAAVRLGEDGARHFVTLRWGLIPSWAKDAAIASKMINARGETVAEKPAFRAAFRARRCLIPADGFYEWKTEGGAKQPYRIARADRAPFAFAGLWERWEKAPDGVPMETSTIITTDANETLQAIHHRMPVILDAADFAAWLDPAARASDLQGLLRPFPSQDLVAYRVSRRVNAVANDDLSLIEPIEGDAAPDGEAEAQARQPRLL
jgi:putative SOS response-associated peptidase YedK